MVHSLIFFKLRFSIIKFALPRKCDPIWSMNLRRCILISPRDFKDVCVITELLSVDCDRVTCSHHTWSDHIPGVIQGPESHPVIPPSPRQSRELYIVQKHPLSQLRIGQGQAYWPSHWLLDVHLSTDLHYEPTVISFTQNTFSKGVVIQCQMSTTHHCFLQSSWVMWHNDIMVLELSWMFCYCCW